MDKVADVIVVTSIYATNDGLATAAKIDRSRALLPSNTVWAKIQSGIGLRGRSATVLASG